MSQYITFEEMIAADLEEQIIDPEMDFELQKNGAVFYDEF